MLLTGLFLLCKYYFEVLEVYFVWHCVFLHTLNPINPQSYKKYAAGRSGSYKTFNLNSPQRKYVQQRGSELKYKLDSFKSSGIMYFQLNGLNYHTKHNLDYPPPSLIILLLGRYLCQIQTWGIWECKIFCFIFTPTLSLFYCSCVLFSGS